MVATYVTPTGEVLGPAGRLGAGPTSAGAGWTSSRFWPASAGSENWARRWRPTEQVAARKRRRAIARMPSPPSGSRRGRLRLPARPRGDKVAVDKDLEEAVREHEASSAIARRSGWSGHRWQGRPLTPRTRSLAWSGGWSSRTRPRGATNQHERPASRHRGGPGPRGSLEPDLTARRVELASATERVEALGRRGRRAWTRWRSDLTERGQRVPARATRRAVALARGRTAPRRRGGRGAAGERDRARGGGAGAAADMRSWPNGCPSWR